MGREIRIPQLVYCMPGISLSPCGMANIILFVPIFPQLPKEKMDPPPAHKNKAGLWKNKVRPCFSEKPPCFSKVLLCFSRASECSPPNCYYARTPAGVYNIDWPHALCAETGAETYSRFRINTRCRQCGMKLLPYRAGGIVGRHPPGAAPRPG